MRTRPPSLRAIVALEAAARHQSFTRAAEELNLTASAVSHAVRALELRLGVDLFDRVGARISLNPAGRAFIARLRVGLSLISEAFGSGAEEPRPRLSVGTFPGLLECVLGHRLDRMRRRFADCDFEFRLASGPDDVASGDLDVAALFGSGGWTGLASRKLLDETMFPVASPRLAATLPADRAGTLQDVALIHQVGAPWRVWFARAGLAEPDGAPGVWVDSVLAAIELARCGAGVCLAPSRLVHNDLLERRLVRLSEGAVAATEGYWAVWNPASARAPLAARFVEWLATEAFGEDPAGSRSDV